MKWAIVFGTTDGFTRVIAVRMQQVLQTLGHEAEVVDVEHALPRFTLDGFDGTWIGGSVHIGRHRPALERFVQKHVATLNAIPSGFFSVSLSAVGDLPEQHEDAERMAKEFMEKTHWQPLRVELVAGALLYRQYNFIQRFLMKRIAAKAGGDTDTSKDYVYTDWEQVERYTHEFAEAAVVVAAQSE